MNIVALFKVPQLGIAYLDIVAYLNIVSTYTKTKFYIV